MCRETVHLAGAALQGRGTIIRENGRRWDGLRPWQALLKAKTLRNSMSLIAGSAFHVDPNVNLCQWKTNANEYEATTGEIIASLIRRSTNLNKMAPLDLRQHLMLNQLRLDTADAISDEVQDCYEAVEEVNKDAKGTPEFVAPVRETGVPYKFGKGGTKGKGKMHHGLGYQPHGGKQ